MSTVYWKVENKEKEARIGPFIFKKKNNLGPLFAEPIKVQIRSCFLYVRCLSAFAALCVFWWLDYVFKLGHLQQKSWQILQKP